MHLGIIITGTGEGGAHIELISDDLPRDFVITAVIAGQNHEIMFSLDGEPIGIAAGGSFDPFVNGNQSAKQFLAYTLMRAFGAMKDRGQKIEQIDAALFKILERDVSDGVVSVILDIHQPEFKQYLLELATSPN